MTDITDATIQSETPKRKRRTKAEMELAKLDRKLEAQGYNLEELDRDNPYNPTVEVVDLEPVHITPMEFITTALAASKLAGHIAELHHVIEPDGSIRRLEFRARTGTVFRVPQQGEVAWATFTGNLQHLPEFLESITPIVTITV